MNYKTYNNIKKLRNVYNYRPFHGKITIEELLDLYNCKSVEELNRYISRDEISFVEDWLNSENINDYLSDKIREDFNKMNPEEISQNLENFLSEGIFDREVLEALPNINFLLNQFEKFDNDVKCQLAPYLNEEDIFKYINENGKASESVIDFLSKSSDIRLINAMKSITSDLTRAKILLKGGNDVFLPYIEDQYYRTQIVKSSSDYFFDESELLAEIEEYNIHLNNITQFKDEKDNAEYISTVKDMDMKQALLSKVQERENRDIVIKSFERNVDPKIASLDKLVQKMIREFFEDVLGEKFTDDKRERLEIVFNRSNVSFGNLDANVNGSANHIFRNIIISDKHQNSINRNLGFLIHEYAHLFSIFDYASTKNMPEYSVEEGMADTFSDLVINHYLNKHKNIELDGKRIRVDAPYITYSGYNLENAWLRTMLAGLVSSDKDIEAVAEYLLGDKLKFTEMVFGKEITETKDVTDFGMPRIITDRSEIYNSPELDFSNIDENSIYYNRNCILPLFKIQNRLKDKADVVGVLSEGKSYYASYVADKYFNRF